MERVVSDFSDPVAALVVFESKQRAVGFADVPDSDRPVTAAGRQRMELASVESNIEDLIGMCCKSNIWSLSLLSYI